MDSFLGTRVPWCSTGYYLDERPVFTLDPVFHAGCYYVQEASSMFLEQVFIRLELNKGKRIILDACAAPGGKTTHIASFMSKESLLVSNEVIGSRISALKENVVKWGNPNVLITNNDPSAFTQLTNLFDVIFIDAPCSGEGLFRKDMRSMDEWSEAGCEICSSRQKRILTSLIPSLKPGGYLVYCTCTFNPGENEENVKWMTETSGMECVSLNPENEWGIREMKDGPVTGYSFFPHLTGGEGFFISVLRKKSEDFLLPKWKKSGFHFKPVASGMDSLNSWIVNDGQYTLVIKDKMVLIQPTAWISEIENLGRLLRVIHSGTCVAELKGDQPIPVHELALSILMNKNSFPNIELQENDALKYLRKEDFKIDTGDKGFALLTHRGYPIGFVKLLENRFNNYYPSQWRIRMR